MKWLRVFFPLFTLVLINSFTQEINNIFNLKSGNTEQNNAVIIDLFPMVPVANGLELGEGFGLGIMYERKASHYFSLLCSGTFLTNFDDIFAYSFSPHFRIYPFKTTIGKLFTDVGIVYRSRKKETNYFHGLSGMLAIGWKFVFEKGFTLEPGFTFRYKITDIADKDQYNFGWGLLLGLGWVF
jgi:hypothetical protein